MNTKERILKIATSEFLEKGYQGASLRKIAKAAKVTTGAMYGYYKSKEALFVDLVKNVACDFEDIYLSQEIDESVVDYIYQNFDIFRLIVCSSKETEYEDYLDRLVETKSKRFKEEGFDDKLSHIISHSYLFGVFEIVRHKMEKKSAEVFVRDLKEFYQAGWNRLLEEKEDLR